MPIITITFQNPLNTSVQVGDVAYYCDTPLVGAHQQQDLENVISLGPIVDIVQWTVATPSAFITTNMAVNTPVPKQGDFIMFSKDNKANMSSILGYYAEIEFRNDSYTEAELFSVGTEVFESSK